MTTARDTIPAGTVLPVASTTEGRGLLPLAAGPGAIVRAIEKARTWLLARQDAAGFWCGELEGDTTLESYMILLEAFFGRRGSERSAALARTIREAMAPGGGWAQYLGGPAEISVSTLSYFALKVAGDPEDAPHMRVSREIIRGLGGVERANTYTKYHLALFGQLLWRDVPAIPPEMVFLPGGGPFTVYDMSSWSRTIFVPLSILYALKPVTSLPASCGVSSSSCRRQAPWRTPASGRRCSWASIACSRATSACPAPRPCVGSPSSAPVPG